MNILEELKSVKILDLNWWGMDFSITKSTLIIFLASALVFTFFFLLSKKAKLIPSPLQSVAEYMLEFIKSEMLAPLGKEGEVWLPFLVTLFAFIFTCNLLGIIPGFSPPTSNINVTASMAVMIFIITHVVGIRRHGVTHYLKAMVPSGLPLPVTIVLFPIELVGQLARPFSLAVRLFANMFAGHTIILMLISLIFISRSFLVVPFSVAGNVAIAGFEIFVALIQAFIFTYLSAFYITGALQTEH